MRKGRNRLQPAIPPGMPVYEWCMKAASAHEDLTRGVAASAERLFAKSIVDDLSALLRAGIDPNAEPRAVRDLAGLESRRRKSVLYSEFWPEIQGTLLRVNDAPRMVAVIDANGYVLAQEGLPDTVRRVNRFGQMVGVDWIGLESATNGIRMAALTNVTAQVAGPQHLRCSQHRVVCSVSPVRDGERRIAGYVNLSAPLDQASPEMMVIVDNLAERISGQIELRSREKLDRLVEWGVRRLSNERDVDPFLVIGGGGSVAFSHGWENDRVVKPVRGFRPGRQVLAGAGEVDLTPLFNGWVVRRAVKVERSSVRVVLDLRYATHARIDVSCPGVSWSYELALGEAELLLAVADRKLTYPELDKWLYAAPPPPDRSTTRVRWHRLMAELGSLLSCDDDQRGFAIRNAPTVLMPPDRRELLPESTAPGVVRLRDGRTP